MKINSLLTKYLSLNKVIKDNGGRIAIEGNGKLEKIYEELLSLEDKILKQFGLPLLMKYREVLFQLAEIENPVSKSDETIYFLSESETANINSSAKQHLELILLPDLKKTSDLV